MSDVLAATGFRFPWRTRRATAHGTTLTPRGVPIAALLLTAGVGCLAVWNGSLAVALAMIPALVVAFARLDVPAVVMLLFLVRTTELGAPQLTVFRMAILVGAGIAIARSRRSGSGAVKGAPRTVVALAAFGLLLLAFLPISPDLVYARRELVSYWFTSVILGLALVYGTTGRRSIRSFLNVIVAIGVVDAMVSLLQALLGSQMPSWYYGAAATRDVFEVYRVGGYYSGFGFFQSRGENALFLLLPLSILLCSWSGERRRAGIPLAVLFMAAIVSSFSRTAIALIPMVWFLAFAGRRAVAGRLGLRAVIGNAVAGCAAYLAMAGSLLTPVFARFEPATVTYDFRMGRQAIWARVLEVIRPRPVFGVGVGGLAPLLGRATSTFAHNAYVELLAETGVVGLSAWLMVLSVVVSRYRTAWIRLGRASPHRSEDELRGALVAFAIYFVAYLAYCTVALSFRSGWEAGTVALVMPDMVLRAALIDDAAREGARAKESETVAEFKTALEPQIAASKEV